MHWYQIEFERQIEIDDESEQSKNIQLGFLPRYSTIWAISPPWEDR